MLQPAFDSNPGASDMWHSIKLFVLPLVTLGAGIVSLYIDPKENQKGRRILLVVLVVAAIGSVVVTISDDREKRSSDQRADAENQQLEKTVENQSKSLENLTGKADTIIARLSGFGLGDATVTQITRSLSADKARQSLLPQVREEQGHRQATIWYFPKRVDGPVVMDALREAGFKVQTARGKDINKDLPTNRIWVGDSILLEDAKFVALTLTRAGVGIAAISRFCDGSGEKANWIEIGTDHKLINSRPLTVEDIQNLPQIAPRDPSSCGSNGQSL